MNTPIFVINLDSSTERLAQTEQQLTAAGLAFQRIAAVDGRGKAPEDFSCYDARASRRYMGRDLRGGEVGCYLSHLAAARAFLDSDAPLAILFEDDLEIRPEVTVDLLSLIDDLNQRRDWDAVSIGCHKLKLFTPLAQIGTRRLVAAHYFPMRATGMIWSRAGAERFLAGSEQIFAPVDNYFRHSLTRSNRGLAIWPPLITTPENLSEIDGSVPSEHRSQTGRGFLYGWRKQIRHSGDKLIAARHKLRAAKPKLDPGQNRASLQAENSLRL